MVSSSCNDYYYFLTWLYDLTSLQSPLGASDDFSGKWRVSPNLNTPGATGPQLPEPLALRLLLSVWSLSSRTLENPHPLYSFFFFLNLTFSLTSPLFFFFSSGKGRPNSSLSKRSICWHLAEKKKKVKSQRSFKILVFEYLKTMNARNVDRSCVRLHSDP